ncbi:hypothetical protein GLA29479_4675 [Lysobacter antibioticus]|uniref:hypothetical protein n=1 Tax=Lysobacter antibioticus TaxID=84531 RepID=UPI000717029A|nr:hypothetical protein [Lysobacter antibioticus]ALN65505.1 hypothetical protein GLA29479_4675 [Lysobacter antibioticus]
MNSKIALCCLALSWPGLVSAASAAKPDVPMRVSPWLSESMDSKTCPIVHVYLAGAGSAQGGSALATVWRSRDDESSALEAWPALHLSIGGQPHALRREGPHSDIETATLQRQRGETLRWSEAGAELSAELRLGVPSLSVEEDGRWTRLPAAQARAAMDDASTLTRWKGHLTVTVRGQRWQREVEVESLCGP